MKPFWFVCWTYFASENTRYFLPLNACICLQLNKLFCTVDCFKCNQRIVVLSKAKNLLEILSNRCHTNPIDSKGFLLFFLSFFDISNFKHFYWNQRIFILFNTQFHASRNFSETIISFFYSWIGEMTFYMSRHFLRKKINCKQEISSTKYGVHRFRKPKTIWIQWDT